MNEIETELRERVEQLERQNRTLSEGLKGLCDILVAAAGQNDLITIESILREGSERVKSQIP
jgi:hypothetical protein